MLEVTGVESIEKEPDGSGRGYAIDKVNGAGKTPSGSIIKISDLLQSINSNYQKYIPQPDRYSTSMNLITEEQQNQVETENPDIRFSPSSGAEGPQELKLPSIYDEEYVEREPETENAAKYNQRKKELDAVREEQMGVAFAKANDFKAPRTVSERADFK